MTIGTMTSQTLSPPKRHVRKLSSATTTPGDLHNGPTVVVPPENLDLPGQAHETATALEIAKHKLANRELTRELSTPITPPETDVTDTYAFAFDIDGVLVRGGKAIPEAIEAMKVLNGQNELGIKMWARTDSSLIPSTDISQTIHLPNEWGWENRAGTMSRSQPTTRA